MLVAAHIMAKHIKELEKEVQQDEISKEEAKIEINKDSIELTYREFKDGVLDKGAYSTRDKTLRSEIIDLFRKAKLIESEEKHTSRQAEEALQRSFNTQVRTFFKGCNDAWKEKDPSKRRLKKAVYCKSKGSRERREITIEDYKEYLEQKKQGTIAKRTKFSKWIYKKNKANQEIKESYCRWKELAGIIKG